MILALQNFIHEMIATGEPLAATIDRLYLEVEAPVPMVMEDNLVKVVLRANG
ncbi:hypothetical protein HX900_21475 [Rhizobium sp. WYCCWR 11290]|uniref:Uncharacterized protein n=1 Tax=Rhizobium changzhiense TaxID=2692317 RepID=A0A7Z0UBR4_9HYPH|nr:hypothetical protein [Rhizobium changzhiense]NZD63642.1 hypothetical protein [Rhizobium changzhiense]